MRRRTVAALLLTADSGKIIFHPGFYPRIAATTSWKVSAECEPFFKSLRASGSTPPMARPEQSSRIERWL